MILNNLHWN